MNLDLASRSCLEMRVMVFEESATEDQHDCNSLKTRTAVIFG